MNISHAVRGLQMMNESMNVTRAKDLADAAEMLWVMLANVNGGDWTQQTPEWQEAAAYWRDEYFHVRAEVDHERYVAAMQPAPTNGGDNGGV